MSSVPESPYDTEANLYVIRILIGSYFQRKSLFLSGLLSIFYKYMTEKEE